MTNSTSSARTAFIMPATKKTPKKTLGINIRKAREAFPMTQLALAHAIGLTGDDAGAYISRVESGQEPRLENLQRIASALNVSLNNLLDSN